ncbi:hypothetical protein KFE80_06240 [bacterium SCSIO 12696]|nr:hypothetical protein KFE80_06240 [bacterium SCSIO 12696]
MKLVTCIFLTLVAMPLVALADISGRVDRIDYTALEIVVDDSFYKLPVSVEVRGKNGESESLFAIKAGMYVRYATELRNNKKSVVLRILDGPVVENDNGQEESRR